MSYPGQLFPLQLYYSIEMPVSSWSYPHEGDCANSTTSRSPIWSWMQHAECSFILRSTCAYDSYHGVSMPTGWRSLWVWLQNSPFFSSQFRIHHFRTLSAEDDHLDCLNQIWPFMQKILGHLKSGTESKTKRPFGLAWWTIIDLSVHPGLTSYMGYYSHAPRVWYPLVASDYQTNTVWNKRHVFMKPRRPPMTSAHTLLDGLETAFRLFQTSPRERPFACIFKKVSICWGRRSVDMITCLYRPHKKHSPRSEFVPELHRWILKMTARHLQILHRKYFDHHGEGYGNFAEFQKMKKKWNLFISLIRDISRHESTCVQTAKAGAKPEPRYGGSGACSPGKFVKSNAIICIFVYFEGHKITTWWLYYFDVGGECIELESDLFLIDMEAEGRGNTMLPLILGRN